MKKALQRNISGTKKLFRKVLSKHSIASHGSVNSEEALMAEQALLKNELDALKEQISHLKMTMTTLQNEIEQKEIHIGNLAREKEKITSDLLKTKRSNANLTQQLENERKFYFNEKQIYCKEMNECKKLKQILSNTGISEDARTVQEYKEEIEKLKQTLSQTLQANYNLSIKFLRMKNTKTCLRSELQAMQLEREKLENDYKSKIEHLSDELNELLNEKLATPTSPSSKKYLQLVKQNSCLVYENLCLQMEVDNLNLKVEKMKLEKTRSETNSRLKYMHSGEAAVDRKKSNKTSPVAPKEVPEKLVSEPQPGCSRECVSPNKSEKVIKLFERKAKPGVPVIKIVNEKKPKGKRVNKKKQGSAKSDNTVKQEVADISINLDDRCRQNIADKDMAQLSLFQISDIQSTVSNDVLSLGSRLSRSHSFPNLSQFVNPNG